MIDAVERRGQAVVPAVAAVIIAAYAAWWLTALLAIPAALLVMW